MSWLWRGFSSALWNMRKFPYIKTKTIDKEIQTDERKTVTSPNIIRCYSPTVNNMGWEPKYKTLHPPHTATPLTFLFLTPIGIPKTTLKAAIGFEKAFCCILISSLLALGRVESSKWFLLDRKELLSANPKILCRINSQDIH